MMVPSSTDPGRRLVPALVAVAMILVAACQPLFGLGQSPGWSVRADNTSVGIDFVLRYSSGDAPSYVALASGDAGVVKAGDATPGADAALAILDPVSCRVVSMLDPIPAGHTSIDLSIEGTPTVYPYDPAEWGDPQDPSLALEPTDVCKDADPASTPLPAPSMVAGDWLNGWEMSCTATGGTGKPFDVRGEFLTGAVNGCEPHAGDTGQPPIKATDGISIWNPDGDTHRLGIGWEDSACTISGTVSLYPTMAGYQAHVISIGPACKPGRQLYSVVFFLTDPIDAGQVRGEVERQLD